MATERIGIVANTDKPNAREVLIQLQANLIRVDLQVCLEVETAKLLDSEPSGDVMEVSDLADHVDLLIVLGGDGTILHIVSQIIGHEVPIMGINIGHLGFLTCATQHACDQVGDWIRRKHYRLSSRSLLKATVSVLGERQATYYGLNEVTVCRGNVSRLIQLETRINEEYLNSYSADGLIIATPTGSTAYSLSAGGPIVDPESGVFVISPICPHALTNRSMVVRNDSAIDVIPTDARDQVILTLDGRTAQTVQPNSCIRICAASYQVQLAFLPEQSFYRTLRQKLHWHGSSI